MSRSWRRLSELGKSDRLRSQRMYQQASHAARGIGAALIAACSGDIPVLDSGKRRCSSRRISI